MDLLRISALAVCLVICSAFDDDALFPSDGFHNVLGLKPFWLQESNTNSMRRGMGGGASKRDRLSGSWQDMLSISGEKVFTIDGFCSVAVTADQHNMKLAVKKDPADCVVPSLQIVAAILFPSVAIEGSTKGFIKPDLFDLVEITVNPKKIVKIKCKTKSTWMIAERKIQISDGILEFGFQADKPTSNFKHWTLNVNGIMSISSHQMSIKISKAPGVDEMTMEWNIHTVVMGDLLGYFGITMDIFKFNDIAFDSTKLEGITFVGSEIKGILKVDESYQVVAKASVSFSGALKSGTVYLILTRAVDEPAKPALAIDIQDIHNIGEALEHFIRQADFISDFGLLGRLERDSIIMLAKDDIAMAGNEVIMKLVEAFITPEDTKMIPSGVNLRVKVPMKDNMKKNCNPDVAIEGDLPDILPITIKITAGGLGFDFPEKFKADLPSMLRCLDPQIASELPVQLFKRPEGPLNIKEITFGNKNFAKITVVVQGPFKFLGGKIELADIDVTVAWKRNEPLTFNIATTVTIGSIAVGLTLEKEGSSYMIAAYIATLRLNEIENLVGETKLLNALSLLGSLKDFGIKDFKLTKTIGDDARLRISGSPILWDWDTASIEGVIWQRKAEPNIGMAIGVVIEGIRLDKLIERVLGNGFFKTAWFSEMVAILICSNADAKVEASGGDKKTSNQIGKPEEGAASPDTSKASKGAAKQGRAVATRHRHRRHVDQAGLLAPVRRFHYISEQLVKRRGKRAASHQHTKIKPRSSRGGSTASAGAARPPPVPSKKPGTPETEPEEAAGDDDDDSDEPDEVFRLPFLSSQTIEQGLTLVGIFNIPQDAGCKGDALCLWLAEKVGRAATIEIAGRIYQGGFDFSAGFIGTIPIVEGKLHIEQIKLEVSFSGIDSSVRLECTMYWADKDILGENQLQFVGAIEVSLTGKLSLEFNMLDIWRRPFQFEYLAFGNLHFSIGIAVGVPLPSIEFGGEVWIGKIRDGANDHAIKVACYVGIDPNRPNDNYVHASLSSLTLSSIFKAFDLGEPTVPQFIADTGFPEGLTVAYSMKGKTIDALDLVIQPGLYLKGTINFLGLKVACEISLNPGTKFMIDIEMSPIDWLGGLILVRRDTEDTKNGPKAYIFMTQTSLTVQIRGYVSIFGASSMANIDYSDTGVKIHLVGKFWNLLEGELLLDAAYGNLMALNFKFMLRVKVDLLRDFTRAIKSYIKSAADFATRKLAEAQSRLEDAQGALAHASSKLDSWQEKINSYQAKLRRISQQIEEAKKNFATDCKAECGQVCVPFLDWNKHCFRVLSWWIGCPVWRNCRWKVDNVICIAGCELKKMGKKFAAWVGQLSIKVMLGITEIGKGLISLGSGLVKFASTVLDFTKSFLETVQTIVRVGSEIAAAGLDWVGQRLFVIEELKLHASLDNEFNACAGIDIKCVIIGFDINYEGTVCVNLLLWAQLAAGVSEKRYPGLKKMNEEIPEIEAKEKELDKDNERLKAEEKKIEGDVNRETSDAPQQSKRDYVPNANEAHFWKLATEPLPQVVTRSAATVEAFKSSAPWVLIRDFDVRSFDHTPHEDENIPAEKRTLDEDWEKHASSPCIQLQKVMGKYSDIAGGLAATAGAVMHAGESYRAAKRSMQMEVDELANRVHETERNYNMTQEERGDLYHWYNEAKIGMGKWEDKAAKIMDDQHSYALPSFRSQINQVLMKQKNTDIDGYVQELHAVGEAAYKRSDIPKQYVNEAVKQLGGIKKDIISLVNSNEKDPVAFNEKVGRLQENIMGVKRSLGKCE